MFKNIKNNYLTLILGIIIIIELLSFLTFYFPVLSIFFLPLFFVITLVISLIKIEWGILAILTELIIGSHGHLFNLPIFNFSFSLRMALWLAVLLAFFVYLIKNKVNLIKFVKDIPLFKIYLSMAFFVILSVFIAIYYNNNLNLIFTDFNSWLFFLLILPISLVYKKVSENKLKRLTNIFLIASAWLAIKTLIIIFFFSHDFIILPELYRWLRDYRIGEITALSDAWPRVFLQSHIYSAIAFLLIIFKPNISQNWNFSKLLLAGLFLSTVIISFSRSFWLALFIVFIIFFLYNLIKLKNQINTKKWLSQIMLTIIFAFSFIIIFNNIPVFTSTSDFSLQALRDRATYQKDEAALASRWSLLPILSQEIMKSPILGFGFGKTVKYQSSDPRVLETDLAGWYETHAFEWGYLDIWLKLGLGGLLTYLTLLFTLLYKSFKENKFIFLAPAILFLIIVNFFTPYLNHPLGIMIIILSSCLLFKDKL